MTTVLPFTLLATCIPGLERVLRREAQMLNFSNITGEQGGVRFSACLEDLLKANLCLRCAERVLLELTSFPALTFDMVFANVFSFPWEDFLDRRSRVYVAKLSVHKSVLFAKRDLQRIIKKAIVERLRKKLHTQTLPEDGPVFELYVKLESDRLRLFFNTSGAGLHKRGYRAAYGKAPLRETLAAGIVLLSGYKRTKLLFDPFCGSATIPIEAAMFSANIPPGLQRAFAFERWGVLDEKTNKTLRQTARDKILFHPPNHKGILCSDIDPKMVALARENARLAGVGHLLTLQRADAFQTPPPPADVLLTNPPYGRRLHLDDRAAFMQNLRALLLSLRACSANILSTADDFPRRLGLQPDKCRPLTNSTLPCVLYTFSSASLPHPRHSHSSSKGQTHGYPNASFHRH